MAWARWVPTGGAVHFRVTSRKSRLYHQDAVAERLERAVLAAIPGARAVRAPSDADALDDDVSALPGVQRFLVRIVDDELTLSVDSSGALLHRRGYRQASAKAPLRETLAAAMLLAMEWDGAVPAGRSPLRFGDDPHRGGAAGAADSPRLAATLRVRAVAGVQAVGVGVRAGGGREGNPGAGRRADRGGRPGRRCGARPVPPTPSGRGWRATSRSVRAALTTTLSDPELAALPPGLVLTNPPYGVRVGESGRLRDLYASLGNAMRGPLAAWSLGFVTSDPALAAATGLPLECACWIPPPGGLPIRLHRCRSSRHDLRAH